MAGTCTAQSWVDGSSWVSRTIWRIRSMSLMLRNRACSAAVTADSNAPESMARRIWISSAASAESESKSSALTRTLTAWGVARRWIVSSAFHCSYRRSKV